MPWLQINFDTNPESAPELEDALLACGSVAVTFQDNADQPILEPSVGETPLWQQTRVTGLFAADTETDQLIAALTQTLKNLPKYRLEILEDKDWEREWMNNYQPMQFGERLWICPSWREPVDPDAVNLMMDPGLAFGTGTHPTTALCLRWLDQQSLEGLTVVDYGCGSGILGIAALLLGAKKVIGVDNDPQALIATRDNLQRNGLSEEQLDCYLPEQVFSDLKADLVIANILAGPLLELAPTLAELAKPKALLALSGLLDSQAEQLQAHYNQWFTMELPCYEEQWTRLAGIKR